MKTVKYILNEKGGQVWTARPEESVFQALERMAEEDVGALVVVDGEHLVGIFSERDYARQVILKGKSSRNTPVREIMTSQVVTARPQQTVQECLAVMARKRIRYLPVVDGEHLVGMISIGDVLLAIIAEQEEELQRLEASSGAGLLDI